MVQRTFIPGSEWLYFKIYTGTKTADDILVQIVGPYVENLYAEGVIDNYFFIRYSDPDFHIRLRLHIGDSVNYAKVFKDFLKHFQPCVDNGMIVKILCDTYVREIERYGSETIESAEDLFRADSAAVMRLLARCCDQPEEKREAIHWQLALLLFDDTLTAFGYELPNKVRIARRMADSYRREFGFTTHGYTKQLNDKYRSFRKNIESALASRSEFTAFEDILQSRKMEIQTVMGRIHEDRAADVTTYAADDLLSSIQHMTMNRWFRVRNRMYELVIYDFLSRYYESADVRNQKGIQIKPEGPENLQTE